MGLSNAWGYFLFFAIPLALWTVGILSVRRRPFVARLFAFVAGGDNRLSLSRLQAFAWTLVIFGAFAAAMCVHTRISSGTEADLNQRAEKAKAALEAANIALVNINAKLTAGSVERSRLEADRDKAERDRTAAEEAVYLASSKWVEIPPELLALAAIAIGSGVFSSLISALDSENKTACVTALEHVPLGALSARFPAANAPLGSEPILVKGNDLGTSGRVRLGSVVAPILFWSGDEKAIVIDGSRLTRLRTLTVETSHGKLVYQVGGTPQTPALGLPTFAYDPADLFRDDKDPSTFSLMKFQMFGWTVIAVIIFSWIFLTNLNPHMSALPNVDKTVVILTGLSQSGYLVGKAVGTVKSSDSQR